MFLTLLVCFLLVLPFSFALTIDQNTVEIITGSSVRFSIITNPDSIVHIYYSEQATSESMALQPNPGSTRRTTHTIDLAGLIPGQRYYYQIVAFNSQESIVDDNSGQFYTFILGQESSPTIPPVISDVRARVLSPGTTAITWTTNVPATTKVYYGLTAPDQSRDTQGTALQHELIIPTQRDQVHYFFVESCNEAGLCSRSDPETFVAGAGEGAQMQIQLDTTLPDASSRTSLDIPVQTIPRAKVEVFVNGVRKRVSSPTETGDSGFVMFYDVPLQPDQTNEVRVVVSDASGSSSEVIKNVLVDISPPLLTLQPLPAAVSAAFQISGDVSEPVTLSVTAELLGASSLPVLAPPILVDPAGPDTARLHWNLDPAFSSYAVYANGILIAEVPQEEYVFQQGAPGTRVLFTVAGVTSNCRVSDVSAPLEVAFDGSGGTLPTLTPVDLSCQSGGSQGTQVQGPFTQSVTLYEGRNLITIRVVDAAGNIAEQIAEILYDTQAPAFVMEETNIADLSPVYDDVAKIRGKITEPAAVYIYVNEDIDADTPTMIVPTDDTGYFTAEVELARDPDLFEASIPGASVGSAESSGWHNRVKIKAVDSAGFETIDDHIYDLIFAKCGQSGIFGVQLEAPTRLVHPDEILDGTAEVFFTLHLTYPSEEKFTVNGREYPRYQIARPPALHIPPLNRQEHDEIEQIDQVGAPTLIWDREFKHGAASISVHGYDFGDEESDDRQESLDKIADTNKGECAEGLAGDIYGCIKVPLELEIQYIENRPGYQTTPEGGVISQTGIGGAVTGDFLSETKVQKVCYPKFEIAIDKTVTFQSLAPGAFEGTAKVLDDAVKLIDKVLEPIRKVENTIFLLWGGMKVIEFVQAGTTAWKCTGRGMLSVFHGQSPLDVNVARYGLCNQKYLVGEDGNAEQYLTCMECSKAILRLKQIQGWGNMLGDRLACPAAPTLQNYIKEQQVGAASQALTVVNVRGKNYYGGSSCAVTNSAGNFITPTTYNSVRTIYEDYKTQKDKHGTNLLKPTSWFKGDETPYLYKETDLNCYGLHPSDSKCCGVEYMGEWNSACLGMNELKQSVCYAAQNENVDPTLSIPLPEGFDGPPSPGETLSCPKLFNALAGMCEAKGNKLGGVAPQHLRTGMTLKYEGGIATTVVPIPARSTSIEPTEERASASGYSGIISGLDPLDVTGFAPQWAEPRGSPELIVRVMRLDPTRGLFTTEGGVVKVERGYFYFDTQGSPVNPSDPYGDSIIQDQKKFHRQIDMSEFFTGEVVTQEQAPELFKAKLCTGIPSGCDNPALVQSLWVRIKQELGTANKPYIVDPTSSLLRSAQCVCLGGLHKSLEIWRGRLSAVSSCFKQVQYTGNGDPSVCQEVLSASICDVVIDILRCVVNTVGDAPGSRIGGESLVPTTMDRLGLGFISSAVRGVVQTGRDITYAMRQGFSTVTDGVSKRYGGTTFYKNLFLEKKLMNAICLWSFTGNYDLDLDDIITDSINDLPIAPQPFIISAQREFMSPGFGVSMYPMHRYTVPFLIDAGADMQYQLQLVCSDDHTCSGYGFEGGRCDCAGSHELGSGKVIRTVETGSLSSGANFEKLYEANLQEAVRFDKVRLTFQYVNNQGEYVEGTPIERRITTHGSAHPPQCKFRQVAGAFTCQYEETLEGVGSARFLQPESVTPNYLSGRQGFILDEEIKFNNLRILQDIPGLQQCSAGECEFTKYLIWDIKNQHGQLVASNYNIPDPRFVLNTDGETVVDRPIIRFDGNWMNIGQSGYASPGQTQCNPQDPARSARYQDTFSITFTLYDAGRAGSTTGAGWTRSNAITIFNGELQQKTITFNVLCSRDGGSASAPLVTGITNIEFIDLTTGARYSPDDGRMPVNTRIKVLITTNDQGKQTDPMTISYADTSLTVTKHTITPNTWFADFDSGERGDHVLNYQFTRYDGTSAGQGTITIKVGQAGSSSLLGYDGDDDCITSGDCTDYFYWLPLHSWQGNQFERYRDAAMKGSEIFKKATNFENERTGFIVVTEEQMRLAQNDKCTALLDPSKTYMTDELMGTLLDDIKTCADALRNIIGKPYKKVIGFSRKSGTELFSPERHNTLGYTRRNGESVVVTNGQLSSAGIVSHELGHTFGLCDVYKFTDYNLQDIAPNRCLNTFPLNCDTDALKLDCPGQPENELYNVQRLKGISGFCAGEQTHYEFMGSMTDLYCGFQRDDKDAIS